MTWCGHFIGSLRMALISKLEKLHIWFRRNWWLWLFTLFTRFLLFIGFFAAGIVKILGERFTDLSNNQPMGHYLEALFHTGYYYTSIGIFQVLAAILLLIPRTVILGVLIYLPIILNITILSFSVRFEGSLMTAPLMVIANLYLLWWHFDRIRYILPVGRSILPCALPKQSLNRKFPFAFFTAVALTFLSVITFSFNAFDVMPRNTPDDCIGQFGEAGTGPAARRFCDCIHEQGKPLETCLEEYQNSSGGI